MGLKIKGKMKKINKIMREDLFTEISVLLFGHNAKFPPFSVEI